MLETDFLSNRFFLMAVSGAAGIFLTWITQRILNKRGAFSYYVTHSKVGTSLADPIFGNVQVSWNDNPIANLYFSTVELKNESLNDYENVSITAFTSDTSLLSESTIIEGTPYVLKWSEDYRKELHVHPGENLTQEQRNTYISRREYSIPVFNRGQMVRLNYLNAAHAATNPHIWVSANVKGVTLRFKVRAAQQMLGVPVQQAALAGMVFGLAAIVPTVLFIVSPWLIALLAFSFGLVAQLPGALLLRGLRLIRQAIGD